MKTETPSFTTQNEKKFLSSEEIALEIETVKNKERIAAPNSNNVIGLLN